MAQMRYTYFQIENYKGIDKVYLDLTRSPKAQVHTLIGLNESGKTTVLEAIDRSNFRENLTAVGPLGYAQSDVHDLIPISKRSNFNGTIVIEAGIVLDKDDQASIAASAKKQYNMTLTEAIAPFRIRQAYTFVASRLAANQPTNTWTLVAKGRTPNKRRASTITGDDWQNLLACVKPLVPRIAYFPNFLFDFPDRIYLDPAPRDEPLHAFYRTVMQDILDATEEKTTLSEHVLTRAKSTDAFDKKALESVLLKMGAHVTKTVFSSWDRIFNRPAGKKEIVVTAAKDPQGLWYLEMRLKEGTEYYDVSERSLGFRWFFTYLLLTQYRGFRSDGPKDVVFLLDEPASNLHPSAQAQLLGSFAQLPKRCTVIYTTHSHHLIRPEWLDGAFVVKNDALTYGPDDDQYSARRTQISVTKYREFAASHPDQTTYFQPVLDVLDYRPTILDGVPDVVMIEGKTDFYALSLLNDHLPLLERVHLLPGTGASSLDAVIQLYIAWARNFIVLLDSDAEGEKQKRRYIEKFGPVMENRTFTIADLDSSLQQMAMEKVIEPDDRLLIQRSAYPDATGYGKTLFVRAVQEAVALRHRFQLSQPTLDRAAMILKGAKHLLESRPG